MPPLINNGTVVHSYFYTNYATTPRSLKIWESTLQSCFPLKFVFLIWPPLPLQLFFLTNYLFILFVAGWYTFKRMNDALIPTLGLILVLWMENPIKVIFLGLPVLTRCEIMHFVWNQCSDKSIEYTGCDHWEKHLSVQLSYKLKVNILSGYTFIVLRVVCTCVSGQIQSAFICLCTSAYVLLHWTVSDFSIAI